MASVFRRGSRWYARYKDAAGAWVKEAGFTDKAATLQLAVSREREALLIRKGLAEPAAFKSEQPLSEILQDFRASLNHKNVSERQIELVVRRCERMFEGCRFRKISEIDATAVSSWLAKERRVNADFQGMSVQTSNHYLRAIKQFTRWLHRHGRIRIDPLIHLEMLNVAVDRRHDRRALTDEEVSRLLKATLAGKRVLHVSPADRHMLYVLALSTGLRVSELGSLRKESLSLECNPPTVKVKAAYSKRRRLDVLPLPTEILSTAKAWLATKKNGQLLWPEDLAKNRYAGKMLQVDLKAANVEYVNADGLFADFHALRHTYITNLARHGVPLAIAQKLARHSTPVLTAARYTHIDLADQHREVEKLGPLIGTNMGQTADFSCPKLSSAGTEKANGPPVTKCANPQKSKGIRVISSGEAGIRTLGRVTPSPVFKTGAIDHSATSPNSLPATQLSSDRGRQSGSCRRPAG